MIFFLPSSFESKFWRNIKYLNIYLILPILDIGLDNGFAHDIGELLEYVMFA